MVELEEFLGVDQGGDQIEAGSVATEQQLVEPEEFLGVDQGGDQIEAGSVATEQQLVEPEEFPGFDQLKLDPWQRSSKIGGAGGVPRRRPRGRPN